MDATQTREQGPLLADARAEPPARQDLIRAFSGSYSGLSDAAAG